MAYLALYRRYRPTDFNGIVGQEHIVKTLVNQIETKRPGHAYLFTGTRGTGKTSTAKIFARAINCEDPVGGSPCGKCAACRALADPSNIDVVEIDAASNNGVNEIRELRENVQFPPVSCKYKVYIIDEVHMLTGAAFNALLKTLEEPPAHAVFILATTEVHKLPATILSRCMRFDFRLVPTEKIAALIASIYDEQGKKYDKDAVFAIAKAGEGSIRDALSIADTALSYSDGKLTYEQVNDILGASNVELITDLCDSIVSSDGGKVLSVIDGLSVLGKSMGVLIKDVTAIMRDMLVIKTCKDAEKILGLPELRYEKLSEIAEKTSEERLLRIMEILSDAESALRYTTHPRVVFETAALKATKPDADRNIDALIARIKALEDKIANISSSDIKAVKPETAIKTKNPKESEEVGEKTAAVSAARSDGANSANNAEIANSAKIADSAEKCADKTPLSELTEKELKGKFLTGLRKLGSEMLWNTMQNVNVTINGTEIILGSDIPEDLAIIKMDANFSKLKDAVADVEYSAILIKEYSAEKKAAEIDNATERLKKLFGDDVVIIKR